MQMIIIILNDNMYICIKILSLIHATSVSAKAIKYCFVWQIHNFYLIIFSNKVLEKVCNIGVSFEPSTINH